MSPDPFFRLDEACHPFSGCEKNCVWSSQYGFCGARIHPDCLRIGQDGSVRVGLSVSAQAWFETLSQLGNVLQITRNPVAALGQIGSLPELVDWRNPVLPRDYSDSLTPNLAEYAGLWAVRECSPVGTTYGLEACDASGKAFHRIFLTSSAQRAIYERFVTDHQSPPAQTGQWFSPNHSVSAHRCRAITNRVSLLRSRLAKGARDVQELPVAVVPDLLAAAAEGRLPIRTTHYHRALIRAVVWMPDALDPSPDEKSGIEFLHGDGVGLHINLPAVTGAWLWHGHCLCCDKQHWTVEIADAADAIGLAFNAGNEHLELDWRDLLKDCLP